MKNYKKLLAVVLILCMLFAQLSTIVGATSSEVIELLTAEGEETNSQKSTSNVPEGTSHSTRFLGLGYNVAGGVSILNPEGAFSYAHPVLDMSNTKLLNSVTVTNITKDTTSYEMGRSAYEIAEKYSSAMLTGIDAKVKIKVVDVGASGMFATETGWEKDQIVQEKYEVYSMLCKKQIVSIGLPVYELRECLSDKFVTDVKKINDSNAEEFLKTYGTHMPSGYTLGGMLEFTSYYASVDETYESAVSTTLDSAVSAGVNANGGGASFSFNENYSNFLDSSKAQLKYKANIYGGVSFPNLTIEQAFTQKLFQGKFMYEAWTDAMNAGENLQIVSVSDKAKMIPIWDLVPEFDGSSAVRTALIKAYINMCGEEYAKFCELYPMSSGSFDKADNDTSFETYDPQMNFLLTGYSTVRGDIVTNKVVFADENETINQTAAVAYVGDRIHIGFENDFEKGDGVVEWRVVDGEECASVVGERTGIVEVLDSGSFTVQLYYNDKEIAGSAITFNATRNIFSGGDGTEKHPYVITSVEDYLNIVENASVWGSHFVLMNNLDFTDRTDVLPIGTSSKSFSGTFDGNNYTISNLQLTAPRSNEKSIGMFAYLSGNVKNLTLSGCKTKVETSVTPSDGYALYVGVLAGVLQGGSNIEKCVITSATAQNKFTSSGGASKKATSKIFAGLLAGKIESATIKEVELSGNVYALNDRSSDSTAYTETYAGVVAGYISSATLSHVAIHDVKQISANAKIDKKATTCSGTIAGHYDGNGTISGVYVYNVYNADSSKTAISANNVASETSDDIIKRIGAAFGFIKYEPSTQGTNVYFKKHASDSNTYQYFQGQGFVEANGWYLKSSTFDYGTVSTLTNTTFKISNTNPYLSRSKQIEASYSGMKMLESEDPINIFGLNVKGTGNPYNYKYSFTETDDGYNVTIGVFNTITKNVLINSNDIVDTRLYLDTEPKKLDYIEGESFDISGMKMYLCKSNGERVLLDNSQITIEDSVVKLGGNAIECKYDKLTYQIDVNGYKKDDIVELRVESFDNTTINYTGQEYDKTKIKLVATHKTGETIDVNVNDCEVVGVTSLAAGKNLVIVSYGDYVTTEFTVEAQDPVVVGLVGEIKSNETLFAGQMATAGKITITVTYEDGSTRVLDDDDYIIEEHTLVVGNNNVNITYLGKSYTLKLEAKEATVESIRAEVKATAVFVAGSKVTKDKIVVTAIYNSGATKVLSDNEYAIGNHILVEGTNSILITYGEKIAALTVQAAPRSIVSVTAEIKPGITFAVGDSVTKEKILVTATYDDESTKILGQNEYTVDENILVEGNNIVVIVCGDYTYTMIVHVASAKMVSISATIKDGAVFTEGGKIGKNHLTVTATYDDGSTRTLASSEYMIEEHVLVAGENTVTIVSGSINCMVTVTAEADSSEPNPDDPNPEEPKPEEPSTNPIIAELEAIKQNGITVNSREEILQAKEKCASLTGEDKAVADSLIQELMELYKQSVLSANQAFENEKVNVKYSVAIYQ